MTTTQHPTHHEPGVQSTQPSTRRLVRSGALAGAIAAVCTTVVAAIASAADVSLEIDATAIPIPAFAWWTIVGAALGVVLARLLRERRRFVVVTTVAAGLSLIPAIAAPDDTATKAVLVGTHLLAVLLVEVRGDRIAPRDVFVDLGQCRQSCGRAVGLADCDRTVEPDDRSVGEPEQLVVPLHDLDPVGLLDTRRVGMERGDRRLRLVLAELIARERSLERCRFPRR